MNRAELNERKASFLSKFNELLKEYEDIVVFEENVHWEQCDGWYESENQDHDFVVDFADIITDEDIEKAENFTKEEKKKSLVDTFEGKKATYKDTTYCNIHIIDLQHFEGNVVTFTKNCKEHISKNKQMRKIYDFSKLELV